ncbi:hypothetical protein M595_3440 [Lyngbya aestuarii BL J]|uniref:Uncharacterized protein n=1 Tax=Lyngbya aestuarii BL J TaxID=1348334 RepID=U7QH19_9CYAN|nr:hypothetical protein M595_3440 [Lyngbya aestuarii BL J]
MCKPEKLFSLARSPVPLPHSSLEFYPTTYNCFWGVVDSYLVCLSP